MGHVVFITDSYHPHPSAGGVCCSNVAEEMSRKHRVTVICLKTRDAQPDSEEHLGQRVVRVSHKWWDVRLRTREYLEKRRTLHHLYSLLLNGIRLRQYLRTFFSRVSIDSDLVRAYSSALDSLGEPVDAVIPICYPMEAVVAAMEYTKSRDKVKLVPYLFDPFVESRTLHRSAWNKSIKRNSHIGLEKQMLEQSYRVFCAPHLYDHLTSLGVLPESVVSTEQPLLKRNAYASTPATETGPTIMTYTGVFDRHIRNPTYLLRAMQIVLASSDSELHLYTKGNCESMIARFAKSTRGLIVHGSVPKQEADEAVAESGVLISVGNIDNLQVPSKVIEYISTGKPIIHFHSAADDAIIEILRNYPLGLCLRQDESALLGNARDCILFCRENHGKSMSFDEVEKIYYRSTPRFVADQILSEIF